MRLVHTLTILGGVLALCGLPARAGTALSARDMQRAAGFCHQGTKALTGGDLAKAAEQYGKALAIVPSYPDAHIGMGHIRMRESRFQEALQEFGLAKDAFAEMGDAILDLRAKRYAETQRRISELRDQIRTYQNAVQAGRGDTRVIERQIATLDDAIRNLEAIDPPSREAPREPPGEIHFHIGNAQHRLGRLDDALKSWETCALKSPSFALVRNNLAVAYWQKGRLEDAQKSLARAAELGFTVNPQFRADLEAASTGAAPPPGAPAKP